jgi:hypothetical protein
MIDWLALIVGGALLAIVFRRAGRLASLRDVPTEALVHDASRWSS